jgi:hypothetical protein
MEMGNELQNGLIETFPLPKHSGWCVKAQVSAFQLSAMSIHLADLDQSQGINKRALVSF